MDNKTIIDLAAQLGVAIAIIATLKATVAFLGTRQDKAEKKLDELPKDYVPRAELERALDSLKEEMKTGLDGIRTLTTQIHGILTAYMAGQSQGLIRPSLQASADPNYPPYNPSGEPLMSTATTIHDLDPTAVLTLADGHVYAPAAAKPENKFLSILKSFGAKFQLGIKAAVALEAKALPVEQDIATDIGIFNPGVGTTLSQLLGVVGNVEMIATAVGASSGTGKQKLQAAIPGVEAAILADPLFKGKTVADLAKYNTAIASITGSLADLADAFNSTTPTTPIQQ